VQDQAPNLEMVINLKTARALGHGCGRGSQRRAENCDESPSERPSSPPCPLRVKTGKSGSEQMFSGLPPKADLRS
jgi:hypothetical protein